MPEIFDCDGSCKRGGCGCGVPEVLTDGQMLRRPMFFADGGSRRVTFADTADGVSDAGAAAAEAARVQMIADMAEAFRGPVAAEVPKAAAVIADGDAESAYARMVADMASAHRSDAA